MIYLLQMKEVMMFQLKRRPSSSANSMSKYLERIFMITRKHNYRTCFKSIYHEKIIKLRNVPSSGQQKNVKFICQGPVESVRVTFIWFPIWTTANSSGHPYPPIQLVLFTDTGHLYSGKIGIVFTSLLCPGPTKAVIQSTNLALKQSVSELP